MTDHPPAGFATDGAGLADARPASPIAKPTSPVTLGDIPHRPPFLFVDEIVEVNERCILTRKFVDPESDFFRGHYPHQPVMPGVLICEACFQSGALLIAKKIGSQEASQDIPVLTRITDARFKRIVRPSDTLDIEVTLDEKLDRAYYMTGRCSVDGKQAVRVTFVCMLAREEGNAV